MVLYNKSKIKSEFLEEDIWNLLDNTFTIPKLTDYMFYEVNEEKYIGRPDLISLDAYGSTAYTDVICKVNGISNPFELNIGMILIIPGANEVNLLPRSAPVNELETNFDKEGMDIIMRQKRKSDVRKTNEAIIGDTRFKIDKNNGIVIY